MNTGWIILHRKFLSWEWYDDINTKTLFIHCLLRANYDDNNWRGIKIKRGQFITSINTLSEETRLTPQQIRTSIKRLENTSEIRKQTTNKYTTIMVCNYDKYQDKNTKGNKQTTKKQQTDNKQTTTDKQYNNKTKQFYDAEIKENESGIFIDKYKGFVDYIYGNNIAGVPYENVLNYKYQLTYKQFVTLTENGKVGIKKEIDQLFNKNYTKNKSIYLTLTNWKKR